MNRHLSAWWQFTESDETFRATGVDRIGRLYYPIFNTAGILSWVTPSLQGGPATSHNEQLGIPVTVEDFPHHLAHRGFWLTETGREPFALSVLCPEGLRDVARGRAIGATVEAAPGWFRLTRADAAGRFVVTAELWCPADWPEPVEVLRVRVRNTGRRALRLTPYAALPLFARSADNVRDHRHVTALLHRVRLHPHGVIVRPTMTFDERGHKLNQIHYGVVAAGPAGARPAELWASQAAFLGEGGSFAAPQAVWQNRPAPPVSPATVDGRETVAGFRFRELTLQPGRSAEFIFVSGIHADARRFDRWAAWARSARQAAQSLAATGRYWHEEITRIVFTTPAPHLNKWLAWVNFQPILRRHYGNSYLPQFDYGRGGKGWRDLWQDCLALLLSDPAAVRPMLQHNFGGVRMDGSNATIIGRQGEFIADRNNIPRTWMDHGVWPTYTTLLYIDQTGDLRFPLQLRDYFRDPQIFRCRRRDEEWTPAAGHRLRTSVGHIYQGTIFEHMLVQNLTAFFNVGAHNLLRLEGADWNDGLDMAAQNGESVAFSAFYAWNLERLAELAEELGRRGSPRLRMARELVLLLDRLPGGRPVNYRSVRAKTARLDEYFTAVSRHVSGAVRDVDVADLAADLRIKARDLATRIHRREWIRAGRWGFFNGYYDNAGRRVEGGVGGRVRMTLTGQVFPVMAGIADEGQVDAVIRAMRKWLRDPLTGGLRLNTDFGGIQPALGRAFSFAYGEKENGAVFSHMAIMMAFALYERRRAAAGRAVWHTLYRMATDPARARIFPGIPEYFNAEGRGMYAFLTGSASWLIYLLLTRVFGVRGEHGDLVLDPQLQPEDFDASGRAEVRCPFAGRTLAVMFHNPRRLPATRYRVRSVMVGPREARFDAGAEGGAKIPRRMIARAVPGVVRLVVELA